MGMIDRVLNKYFDITPVEEIKNSKGEQEFTKYPILFRIHRKAKKSSEVVQPYRIGIIGGLGLSSGYERNPEPHANSKIETLREKLYEGSLDLGIINTWDKDEANRDDLLKRGFPQDKIYESRARGHVPHLYNDKKIVEGLKRKGRIPHNSQITFYHIADKWFEERARFNAGWVMKEYNSEFTLAEDSRSEEVKAEDIKGESRGMRIDRRASRIPLLSTYRPDFAFYLSVGWDIFRYGNKRAFIERYKKRFLP